MQANKQIKNETRPCTTAALRCCHSYRPKRNMMLSTRVHAVQQGSRACVTPPVKNEMVCCPKGTGTLQSQGKHDGAWWPHVDVRPLLGTPSPPLNTSPGKTALASHFRTY